MKALKVIGGIVGGLFATLLLAAGIFYVGWLSPPSPESVCDNLARVTKKEAGVALPPPEHAKCLARVAKEPEFGRANWVKQLKCMRDAGSRAELSHCDEVRAF
jgi:hypothetical protein